MTDRGGNKPYVLNTLLSFGLKSAHRSEIVVWVWSLSPPFRNGSKVFRKIFEREKKDVREIYGPLLKKDTATYVGSVRTVKFRKL
jgi:hypothetical protein